MQSDIDIWSGRPFFLRSTARLRTEDHARSLWFSIDQLLQLFDGSSRIHQSAITRMHLTGTYSSSHIHGYRPSPQHPLHEYILRTQQRRYGILERSQCLCRASQGAAAQSAKKAVVILSAAIWLTNLGPAAHADDATAASFNKNCIGDSLLMSAGPIAACKAWSILLACAACRLPHRWRECCAGWEDPIHRGPREEWHRSREC